jgi:hypothetical protein
VGLSYRASNQGQKNWLALGYSTAIVLMVASEVTPRNYIWKGKKPVLKLTSFIKQLLESSCCEIRGFRKPEPERKGVKFVEVLRNRVKST